VGEGGRMKRYKNFRELIEERSIPVPESGCWVWLGCLDNHGYGSFRSKGENFKAHRVAFEAFSGVVPDGHVVCHRCDVRYCVNPSHLFVGTQAENLADAVAKGRMHRGEAHGSAKLSEADVRVICNAEGLSQRELARKFGVTQMTIQRVRSGKAWAHISRMAGSAK
jgi:hypothetical protein